MKINNVTYQFTEVIIGKNQIFNKTCEIWALYIIGESVNKKRKQIYISKLRYALTTTTKPN